MCVCSYLGLQGVPLLQLGVELPGVEAELHLPQEAVVAKAVVVPHRQLQCPGLQLGVADHVLHTPAGRGGGRSVHTHTDTHRYTQIHVHTHKPNLQVLVEDRAGGVGLDAGLPLALSRFVWEEVSLDIAATEGATIQLL